MLCFLQIFNDNNRFDLKPLHKRIGNWIVANEKDGGYFIINICGFLNPYSEQIPTSCAGYYIINLCIT